MAEAAQSVDGMASAIVPARSFGPRLMLGRIVGYEAPLSSALEKRLHRHRSTSGELHGNFGR